MKVCANTRKAPVHRQGSSQRDAAACAVGAEGSKVISSGLLSSSIVPRDPRTVATGGTGAPAAARVAGKEQQDAVRVRAFVHAIGVRSGQKLQRVGGQLPEQRSETRGGTRRRLVGATGVPCEPRARRRKRQRVIQRPNGHGGPPPVGQARTDRKSTRLNSSHPSISYAVFCLKKKKTKQTQ